jgi:hypothetical protein
VIEIGDSYSEVKITGKETRDAHQTSNPPQKSKTLANSQTVTSESQYSDYTGDDEVSMKNRVLLSVGCRQFRHFDGCKKPPTGNDRGNL